MYPKIEESLHRIRVIVLFSVFVEGVRRRRSDDDVAKAEGRLRRRFQIEDSVRSGKQKNVRPLGLGTSSAKLPFNISRFAGHLDDFGLVFDGALALPHGFHRIALISQVGLVEVNALEIKLISASVRAVSDRIPAASRLRAASVGVETRVADRLSKSEQSTVCMNRLDVFGVILSQTSVRILDAEQRQSRVEGNDFSYPPWADVFTG